MVNDFYALNLFLMLQNNGFRCFGYLKYLFGHSDLWNKQDKYSITAFKLLHGAAVGFYCCVAFQYR